MTQTTQRISIGGRKRRYLSFDGSNDSISFDYATAHPWLVDDGDFTITFWAKIEVNNKPLFNSKSAGAGYQLASNASGRVTLVVTDGSAHTVTVTAPEVTTPSSFNFYAFSSTAGLSIFPRSNATADLEVDNTSIVGSLNNNSNFVIGSSGSLKFTGSIDDIRIYKNFLPQEDIDIIYNAGMGCRYRVGQLSNVAYEPSFALGFNEGRGLTTRDSIGKVKGVLAGGAKWKIGGVPFPASVI
jgi:hypothetical protein